MALRHWTARGTTLIVGLAFCSSVWAQTLTLQKNSRGIVRESSHDRDLDLDEINYADCSADETITFNIGLSQSADSEYQLEVWRGTNCNDRETRFNDSSGCVKLASLDPSGLAEQIPVRVRDIVSGSPTANGGSGGTGGTGGTGGSSGSGGTSGSGASSFAQAAGFGAIAGTDAGGTSGTAGTGGVSAGTGGVSAGTGGDGGMGGRGGTGGASGSGAAGGTDGTEDGGTGGGPTIEGLEECESDYSTPQKASLHFFLANASGASPSDSIAVDWTVTYDLVGPAPPTGLKAGIGENTLVLSWSLPSDTTEIDGYDAYCDPPPGGTVIGASGAGGADGEPPDDDDDCESSSIVRNELPPGAFLCGSTSGATSSMETRRLENGVNYTVALAARDNFKNRGKLSDTTCNTPQLVTDFFESYREAGGKGGGGFCSIHAGPSSTLAGALAVAALALVARRRSRRGIVSKDPS